MTLEVLTRKIGELIVKRKEAHGNVAEQNRISDKLSKLYNLKYTMLAQQADRREQR